MAKKRVLYITNIEVPYRTRFFNKLGEHCDLTVLYERKKSDNRDETWASSEEATYKKEYLRGIKIGNEKSFSLGVLKYLNKGYDRIIIGCFNTPIQMLAILAMKITRRKYFVNVDGKMFDTGSAFKRYMRRFFVRGAEGYLVAGEKMVSHLKDFVGDKAEITPYLFSSLSKDENDAISCEYDNKRNEGPILVIGQYEDYKGLDLAAQVAKMNPAKRFAFVGMGKKTSEFRDYLIKNSIRNVETIPFLQREELSKLYDDADMLVLPSRQECWGLVVNEAAAHGLPIVSTWGSGAAEEFLSPGYEKYLAKPDNTDALNSCVQNLLSETYEEKKKYSEYLKNKSRDYNIEENVDAFVRALDL